MNAIALEVSAFLKTQIETLRSHFPEFRKMNDEDLIACLVVEALDEKLSQIKFKKLDVENVVLFTVPKSTAGDNQ